MLIKKAEWKYLQKSVYELVSAVDTFCNKIDNYNVSVTEVNNRIKSFEIDFRDFATAFRKAVLPLYTINPGKKKFKPKDKELYEEEQKEYTNLYI